MSGLGYSNAKSVRISHIELSETKSKNPEINFQGSGKLVPFGSMVQNYIVNVKEFLWIYLCWDRHIFAQGDP